MKIDMRVTEGSIAKRRSWAAAILVACAAAAALATGCSESASDEAAAGRTAVKLSGTVRISGSTTMAPMISEMAKEFQKTHPGITIEVQTSGSGRGLKDANEGKSDIGMVAKVVPAEERELVPFLIARDGIGISVNSGNPVKSLTEKQVAAMYTKKITSWREVGGLDIRPHVIAASPDAGSTELFLSHLRLKHTEVQADVLVEANKERFAALEKNPGAIMYSSLGEGERRAAAGEKLKMLPVDGVAATSENLAAGRYPLARPLALVTKGLPSGPVKAFIDYARSPAATPLIERYEFVPYRD